MAVFPSDHYVSDDAAFMLHVALAAQVVSSFPWTIVLLGARPTGAGGRLRLDRTAEPLEVAEQAIPVRRIRQFWEQPSLELARRLLDMECLWNTFVLVASLPTLLEMMMKSLPALYASFAEARSKTHSCLEDRGLTKVYDTLPSIDLSSGALARGAKRLAVLPLSGVEWSDLDEPGRAFAVRECLGIHHRTAAVSQCGSADERPFARITSRVSRAAAFPLTHHRQWWIS